MYPEELERVLQKVTWHEPWRELKGQQATHINGVVTEIAIDGELRLCNWHRAKSLVHAMIKQGHDFVTRDYLDPDEIDLQAAEDWIRLAVFGELEDTNE